MLQKLGKLLLANSSNWKYWLAIAFLSRLILFLLVMHYRQYESFPGFWGGLRGDVDGYVIPFENLANTGIYAPDYRMPGFGVLYYPLILIFPKAIACNVLICIQLILSSLSVYALALIVKKLLNNSNALFYLTFFLYTISIYSSLFDAVIGSESLTTSLLIFSVYFFTRDFENYKVRDLIFSGTFLAWTAFLRPIFTPLVLVYFTLVIIQLIRSKKKLINAFLFLLPFILADGSWTVRNYIHYKEVIPLTRTVFFPWIEHTHLKSMVEFAQAWGGAIWFIDPNAEIYWFSDGKPCPLGNTDKSDSLPFPNYIYTSQFNKDSLKVLKGLITHMLSDSSISVSQKDEYQKSVIERFTRYTLSIKKEKPYIFYIKSSERRMSTMLFNIHTVSKLYINNFITNFYNIFYYTILWLGLIGSLLMLPFIFKMSIQSILPIIPIYTILIHTVIVRENENRYLIPAWPFLIICAACSLYWGYSKLFPNKQIK